MKLWTLQNYHFWEVLQAQGTITTDLNYIDKDWLEGQIFTAYQWLAAQMEQRVGPRPYPDAFPLWAWYQWHGVKRKRPDLRSSGYLLPGERGVRIEFEIEDHLILLSDYMLWHIPLNRGYVSANDEDAETFYAETDGMTRDQLHADPGYHQHIINSWERIFDLNWSDEKLSVQATFWELHLSQVKEVTTFIAR